MLLFSIGLPGRFAQWCDAVIASLAGQDGAEILVRESPAVPDMVRYDFFPVSLDEVALALISSSANHLVMVVRQPDHKLLAALGDTDARFVVALDSPLSAAAEFLADTGTDAKLATRAVATSCAAVMRFREMPGALVLDAERARSDPAGTVSAIAQHLGLSADPAVVATAAGEFPSPGPAIEEIADSDVQRAMRGAFAGYEECFAGRPLGQIVWYRDLFFAGGRDGGPQDVLDLGAGARTVIFGPFIHLPPGPWSARVYLGVSPDAAGQEFLIDAFSTAPLATTSLQPPAAGAFATDLAFSLGEPSGPGLEIRVTVCGDHPHGRLAFSHVLLTPVGASHPDAVASWEQEIRAMLGAGA